MAAPTATDFNTYWTASQYEDFWRRNPVGAQAKATALATATALAFAPSISTVSPITGPAAGGTAVTIKGSGFTLSTGVLFGATAATSVVIVDDSTITCVAPAHAAGAVTVTVSNPKGDGVKATAYTYV